MGVFCDMAVFSVKLGHDHNYQSTTKHPWYTTRAGQQGRAKKCGQKGLLEFNYCSEMMGAKRSRRSAYLTSAGSNSRMLKS